MQSFVYPCKVSAGTICVALLLVVSIPSASEAADKHAVRFSLKRDKMEKKAERRAVRKAKQKKIEEVGRKVSARDSLRLDHKLDITTTRITDAKIKDQKYPAAEMRRKREEAKLAEEKIHESERKLVPPGGGRIESLMEREKRDPLPKFE